MCLRNVEQRPGPMPSLLGHPKGRNLGDSDVVEGHGVVVELPAVGDGALDRGNPLLNVQELPIRLQIGILPATVTSVRNARGM